MTRFLWFLWCFIRLNLILLLVWLNLSLLLGFSTVSMLFTGIYLVLLGFTGFYWVLPKWIGFEFMLLVTFLSGYKVWINLTNRLIEFVCYLNAFYWDLPSFTGFYRVLLGFTQVYWLWVHVTGFFHLVTRFELIWQTVWLSLFFT